MTPASPRRHVASGTRDFRLRFEAGKIAYWASRYVYDGDDAIQETLVPRVRARGFLTKADFLTICEWKSKRPRKHYESNPDDLVREVQLIALSTEHERLRIGVLTLLSGVSWPVASAILHFCHVEPYPILDYRALWSLGLGGTPSYSFGFWWDYVLACRALASEHNVTMRTLDRALWQYSRDNQSQ